MGILANYVGSDSFWTLNPQLRIPEVFERLYISDKSSNKEQSSKIMYALFFYLDPTEENKFANIPTKDRESLIKKDFLKDPKFKFEDYKVQMDFIKDTILSHAARSLFNLKKELEEREKFLTETPWDLETGDKKDKLLANTENLFKLYDRLYKTIQKEAIESKDKGGSKPTASDTGSM